MYVTIGQTTYTDVSNLSFAPETDIFGESVPINEFDIDINTDDNITVGQYINLYDDLDNIWARYWIIYAERIDHATIRVRGQSHIRLLERDTLPAQMYTNASVPTVISTLFSSLESGAYSLDSSFNNQTITGFCPEQTAKERLQWVCFVIGAYIKSYFSDKIEILPIDETPTTVPKGKTYYKPSVVYRDYLSAINIVSYLFTPGTPGNTDEYVTDGTNYWIVTKYTNTVSNPDYPSGLPPHEKTIDGVYLVNSSNVANILNHLGSLSFKRTELEAAVINNAEYEPGQRVMITTDNRKGAIGYIASCAFQFGLEAKGQLHLVPVEEVTIEREPVRLEVKQNPTKMNYNDGETLDLTGVILNAYKSNGDLWTDTSHPNGDIPLSELIYNPTTIDVTQPTQETGSIYARNILTNDGPITQRFLKITPSNTVLITPGGTRPGDNVGTLTEYSYPPHTVAYENVTGYRLRVYNPETGYSRDTNTADTYAWRYLCMHERPAASKNTVPYTGEELNIPDAVYIAVHRYYDNSLDAVHVGPAQVAVLPKWIMKHTDETKYRYSDNYAAVFNNNVSLPYAQHYAQSSILGYGRWYTEVPDSPSTSLEELINIPLKWARPIDGELLETSVNVKTALTMISNT